MMSRADSRQRLTCPFCDRTFTRQEHRTRHVFAHTNTRPFTCTICEKRFGRRDVYQRHVRLQHSEHAAAASMTRTPRRTRTACDGCHSRKLKCSPSGTSCERCVREGHECSFSEGQVLTDPSSPSGLDLSTPSGQGVVSSGQEASHSMPGFDSAGSAHADMLDLPSPTSMADPYLQQGTFAGTVPGPALDNPFFYDLDMFDQFLFPCNLDMMVPYSCLVTDPAPLSNNVSAAYARLQEYSRPTEHTRPASPTAQHEHDKWIKRLGEMQEMRYDRDVLNIFLNLFRVHLAPTFRCFEDFDITETTPLELALAMAGIGALYCSAPGAEILALSLYNSTRVKLLSKVHHQPLSPGSDRLGTLQTYMLLELFGYISGDERLHEIAEVYHWEMVQIVQMYNLWPSSGSDGEKERKRTIEGLCILECYRVSILNGSPTFGLALPLALNPGAPTTEEGLGEESEPLQTQLQWMFSEDANPSSGLQSQIIESDTWSLCCMSLLLAWALPNSNLQRHQLTPRHTRRREFMKSALNRWKRMCYDQSSHSTRLLFHLVSLSLHANLVQIEKTAYQHCADTTQTTMETISETNTQKYCPSPTEVFASDVDRLNAAWHSSRIMRLTSEWRQEKTNNRLTEEPPHLVYCVFFATLTLVSARGDGPSKGDATVVGPVPYASQALLSSSVPVSKKLLFVLQSLH